MRSIREFSGPQFALKLCLLILLGSPLATAQPASPDDRTFPALMVSDIHFDPFHDPAQARQLAEAPVTQWDSILSTPPSPNQQQDFAALQQKCGARGVDTPYPLLRSSLQAMKIEQPDAKFITLSGDLLVHSFSCRYDALLPASTPPRSSIPPSTQSDYQAFVLKTLSFVMQELRAEFPRIPVYVALGNNDTPCGDYRLDPASDFLRQAGKILTEDLPSAQKQRALHDFAEGGYYSLTMAEPMHRTRLIVINDIFLAPQYHTCAGRDDSAAATAEMRWLQQQLAQARSSGERVWVMGHIPPGVDPYLTIAKLKNVCGNEPPAMFLSSNKLDDLLTDYASVIRLGIFAHSHMDELRLLQPQTTSPSPASQHRVAIKLVPSISPVDGNNPSFIAARINPSSAELQDYQVIAASNQTGIGTTWSQKYDFAESYHKTPFSPSTVNELITEFARDPSAKSEDSQDYIRNYFAGDLSALLKPFWPLYVCSLANRTPKAYAACVCAR